MKITLIFSILMSVLSIGLSSLSMGDYRDPNHPGMCVINSKLILPNGIHQHPDRCARITCSDGFVEFADCGVQIAGPGCTLGDYENPDSDYPDCCMRKFICDEKSSPE